MTISSNEPFCPKVTLWLSQYGYEPPAETAVYLKVRIEEARPSGEVDWLMTWDLQLQTAVQVAATMAELATLGGVSS